MNKNLYLSKEMKEVLLANAKSAEVPVCGYGIPVYESPVFPFQIHYDACDIESRQEVKIASGEWIHGAIIPAIEPEIPKPSFEFSFDTMQKHIDKPFRNRFERNWGMEIFRF
jgi:hypothetical protein